MVILSFPFHLLLFLICFSWRICVEDLKAYLGQTGWSPSSAGTGHSGFPGILLGTCHRKQGISHQSVEEETEPAWSFSFSGKRQYCHFFQTVNRLYFQSGDRREPHSHLLLPFLCGWKPKHSEKPHRHKEKQATSKLCQLTLADNEVPQRLTVFSSCC